MRRLTSIVAVNSDGVIGCRNSLPWRVKSDLAFFRSVTTSNVVLMGRKTFDSLGRCLPNRYNIILSNQFQLFPDRDGCVVRNGVIEGLVEAESPASSYREAFVIGGATMYEQFHDLVDRYLITVVKKDVPDGDAFFNMDIFNQPSHWSVRRMVNQTQGEGDEAPYEVFEVISAYAEARQFRRAEMVSAMLAKRSKPLSGRKSQSVKVDGWQSPAFNWL